MTIEFEKGFDTLEFDCIEKTLDYFNFGVTFKKMDFPLPLQHQNINSN